jgi:hypothetical protein
MIMSPEGHGTKRARASNNLPDHTNSNITVFVGCIESVFSRENIL